MRRKTEPEGINKWPVLHPLHGGVPVSEHETGLLAGEKGAEGVNHTTIRLINRVQVRRGGGLRGGFLPRMIESIIFRPISSQAFHNFKARKNRTLLTCQSERPAPITSVSAHTPARGKCLNQSSSSVILHFTGNRRPDLRAAEEKAQPRPEDDGFVEKLTFHTFHAK